MSKKRYIFKIFRLFFRMILGRLIYEKIQFRRHTGYSLNLKKPTTFNEKLVARKLNHNFKDALFLQDKFESRAYVERKVGNQYLIDLYDIANTPDELNYSNYPNKFVMKATNSCGANSIFIHNKKYKCDPNLLKTEARSIINANNSIFDRFYYYTNEWWYEEIPTRIIVEEFLVDKVRMVPLDYKFYVFHGQVKYIQVDIGRYVQHTRMIYDKNWAPVDVVIGYPKGQNVDKPCNFDKMIEVAEAIGSDYGFIRVDLYNIDDDVIKFGELTIAPSLGHAKISPQYFDKHLGSLWDYKPNRSW